MPTDPQIPPFEDNSQAGRVPPPLPASEPPVIGAPPLETPRHSSSSARQLLVVLLSLCLGLFLADAVVSLADDSLVLWFHVHALAEIRGFLFLFSLLLGILVYGLMGLTPMIPKRLFLPVTLFNPLAGLAALPVLVYTHGRIQQVAWGISFCQVICGLGVLCWAQGGFKLRWPLVAEDQLGARRFGWRNLLGFVLVNVCVLLPAIVVYLVLRVGLAVDHFSAGFLALRPAGFTVQVRKYVRDDGKTIELVPMAHIGDPGFYRDVAESFPTNSIILLEGVTDDKNLLTNKLSYKRVATSLGLAEQQKEFRPTRGKRVRADVDVDQFAASTIDLLNVAMLVQARGLNADTLVKLMQYSPPPHVEDQLWDDLLAKRNRHLLAEIKKRLAQSDTLIVPWGAAHMPELAREIQKSGFRLEETHDYTVIRFRGRGNQSQGARPAENPETPK